MPPSLLASRPDSSISNESTSKHYKIPLIHIFPLYLSALLLFSCRLSLYKCLAKEVRLSPLYFQMANNESVVVVVDVVAQVYA